MDEFNVLKLVKEGFCFLLEANQVGPDDDYKLDMVKLKVEPKTMEIKKKSSPGEDLPRTIKIVRNQQQTNSSAEVFGQVRTSHNNENVIEVTLEKGVTKGLNQSLELPLTDEELRGKFGSYLEIDPSKFVSHINKNMLKLTVSVEQALGAQGASVKVSNKVEVYTASFTCTVTMKGKVLKKDGDKHLEATIGYILQILKDNKSKPRQNLPEEFKYLTIKGDKVQYTMAGELEFRYQPEQIVHLQDSV